MKTGCFQVIHGAERGEMAALFLSPLRPSFRNLSDVAQIQNRSQFTFFLAAPLLAFCQLAGLSSTDVNPVFFPSSGLNFIFIFILFNFWFLSINLPYAARLCTMMQQACLPQSLVTGK